MEPIEELTRKIAAQETTSRRKFFATLGKVAAGASAVVAGISLANEGVANAATLTCCTGKACSGLSCPSKSSVQYTWLCCDGTACNTGERCNDCCTSKGCPNWSYVCTYQIVTRIQGCPC